MNLYWRENLLPTNNLWSSEWSTWTQWLCVSLWWLSFETFNINLRLWEKSYILELFLDEQQRTLPPSTSAQHLQLQSSLSHAVGGHRIWFWSLYRQDGTKPEITCPISNMQRVVDHTYQVTCPTFIKTSRSCWLSLHSAVS